MEPQPEILMSWWPEMVHTLVIRKTDFRSPEMGGNRWCLRVVFEVEDPAVFHSCVVPPDSRRAHHKRSISRWTLSVAC